MTTTTIQAPDGPLATYVATPQGTGPWPGVCVIHDALGMTPDARRQADWLAEAGYLAATPDLFRGRTILGCMRRIMLDFVRGEGPMFDRVEVVRQWLRQHEQSTGKVGVIGFCFGGGFALLLAPTGRYDAASVNYGNLPPKAEALLRGSCPTVASYGALDKTLPGAADKLTSILAGAGVPHDVKEYAEADHSFMNDHSESRFPALLKLFAVVFSGDGDFHPEATADARQRIIAFFDAHLKAGAD